MQRHVPRVLEHHPSLLLTVGRDVRLSPGRREQMPSGERADQPALAALPGHHHELLPLRPQQRTGDLDLERFERKSDPIAEIRTDRSSCCRLRSDFDTQRPPTNPVFRTTERFSRSFLRSALPGGPIGRRSQKTGWETALVMGLTEVWRAYRHGLARARLPGLGGDPEVRGRPGVSRHRACPLPNVDSREWPP
jgi:hypothetical protein